MRTAILAAAALGLVFVASANAAPAIQQTQQQQTQAAQNTCPPGYYWSLTHYDRWSRLWPTGCTPNNT